MKRILAIGVITLICTACNQQSIDGMTLLNKNRECEEYGAAKFEESSYVYREYFYSPKMDTCIMFEDGGTTWGLHDLLQNEMLYVSYPNCEPEVDDCLYAEDFLQKKNELRAR